MMVCPQRWKNDMIQFSLPHLTAWRKKGCCLMLADLALICSTTATIEMSEEAQFIFNHQNICFVRCFHSSLHLQERRFLPLNQDISPELSVWHLYVLIYSLITKRYYLTYWFLVHFQDQFNTANLAEASNYFKYYHRNNNNTTHLFFYSRRHLLHLRWT